MLQIVNYSLCIQVLLEFEDKEKQRVVVRVLVVAIDTHIQQGLFNLYSVTLVCFMDVHRL